MTNTMSGGSTSRRVQLMKRHPRHPWCVAVVTCVAVGCAFRGGVETERLHVEQRIDSVLLQRFGDLYGLADDLGEPATHMKGVEVTWLTRRMGPVHVFRVAMLQPDALLGRGAALTHTVTCVVLGEAVHILESDSDVVAMIEPLLTPSRIEASEALAIIHTFADLRSMVLQIGRPTEVDDWASALSVDIGENHDLRGDENAAWAMVRREREASRGLALHAVRETHDDEWSLRLNREAGSWLAEFVLVSPDHYFAYRYRLTIRDDARLQVERRELPRVLFM